MAAFKDIKDIKVGMRVRLLLFGVLPKSNPKTGVVTKIVNSVYTVLFDGNPQQYDFCSPQSCEPENHYPPSLTNNLSGYVNPPYAIGYNLISKTPVYVNGGGLLPKSAHVTVAKVTSTGVLDVIDHLGNVFSLAIAPPDKWEDYFDVAVQVKTNRGTITVSNGNAISTATQEWLDAATLVQYQPKTQPKIADHPCRQCGKPNGAEKSCWWCCTPNP